MKGQVNIYSGGELLFSGNNMIVDGFGEQIATMLTVPPSLVNINYASALLDTSNYTIQAISFGKDASGFLTNADGSNSLSVSGSSLGRIWAGMDVAGSSYRPVVTLPQEPSPLDRLLERINSGLSAIDLYGQNLNLIPYYAQLGLTSAQGYQYGCYPLGAGSKTVLLKNQTSATLVIYQASSAFNQASCMDWRGFITKATSGLTVSAASNASSTCIVDYVLTVSKGDLACVELYGGIYSIGLWGLDSKSLICGGRMPPYVFNPINTLDYKLMAKKSLTVDLAKISDLLSNPGHSHYDNLTIVWRLTFN